jgi:KaiC/GvpD/RAD55 family RecA-like ATPase
LDRIKTGIEGFDEMVEGGIPAEKTTLISGGPGAGKTIFCAQYISNGATKLGENGIYVTLDEDPSSISNNMIRLGIDLKNLERQGKLCFIDASPVGVDRPKQRTSTGTGFDINDLLGIIRERVTAIKAKRIVIDPVSALLLADITEHDRRVAVVRLFKGLSYLKCTTVATTELLSPSVDGTYQVELFAADGVVTLETLGSKGNIVKSLRILKMRGTSQDSNFRPYNITEKGIIVFPQQKILLQD